MQRRINVAPECKWFLIIWCHVHPIDWLIDWLTDWVCRSMDWSIDWLRDRVHGAIDRLIDWSNYRTISCFKKLSGSCLLQLKIVHSCFSVHFSHVCRNNGGGGRQKGALEWTGANHFQDSPADHDQLIRHSFLPPTRFSITECLWTEFESSSGRPYHLSSRTEVSKVF